MTTPTRITWRRECAGYYGANVGRRRYTITHGPRWYVTAHDPYTMPTPIDLEHNPEGWRTLADAKRAAEDHARG